MLAAANFHYFKPKKLKGFAKQPSKSTARRDCENPSPEDSFGDSPVERLKVSGRADTHDRSGNRVSSRNRHTELPPQ
jgi:hypothetical protein